jgi:hypothetical protein
VAQFGNSTADDWTQRAKNPANPKGLTQTNERLATAQSRWDQGQTQLRPWGVPKDSMLETARSWYTGANAEGTENGWNTDFYRRSFEQYQQWQNRAMTGGMNGRPSPSTFYGWLDPTKNPTATGVATWGADPLDEDAKNSGQLRFGDVFDNGRKVANIYDDYAGDPATADVMMGEFLFDADTKARMFNDPNRNQKYREEVEKARVENTNRSLYSKTAEDYQNSVAEREESLRRGWGDESTILGAMGVGAATGAAGGAVVGGFFGGVGAAPGAIVGGIVGGVSGLLGGVLNQD